MHQFNVTVRPGHCAPDRSPACSFVSQKYIRMHEMNLERKVGRPAARIKHSRALSKLSAARQWTTFKFLTPTLYELLSRK